jgi:hypothetical protein
MADSSVVEELLEKGARAILDGPGEWIGSGTDLRELTAAVLDAVLPGWREGITRDLAWQDQRNGLIQRSPHDLLTTQGFCGNHDAVVARWVGPWLPVEDGTT